MADSSEATFIYMQYKYINIDTISFMPLRQSSVIFTYSIRKQIKRADNLNKKNNFELLQVNLNGITFPVT